MTEHNNETQIARQYHEATKYVLLEGEGIDASIQMGTPGKLGPAIGEQNPEIEPLAYKIYTELEPIPLPRDLPSSRLTALAALTSSGDIGGAQATLDLEAVARLCLWSNGVMKRWTSPWGKTMEFRASAGTGARYHLELYLVTGDLPGLAAGVYHYSAHDHALRQLRAGDFRGATVKATGSEPAVAQAPVVGVLTSTFWRNSWRYQERTYRHALWDVGTITANIVPVAASLNISSEIVLGFADEAINRLVGADGDKETALALVAFGGGSPATESSPAISTLSYATQPLSSREIDFPWIQRIHHASELESGAAAAAWRAKPVRRQLPPATGRLIQLKPIPESEWPNESIFEVITRRRSNRHYADDQPLSFAHFSTVLANAKRGARTDALAPDAAPLGDLYLVVNNVEGLDPGAYLLRQDSDSVELVEGGDLREMAQRLACGQEYAARSHVNVYAMTDLEPVLERFGNRGYRLAQFEAAHFESRLQLAAHALGLGAVGSTCPDDELTEFLSPSAAGKSFMFIAVFGNKRKATKEENTDASRYLEPQPVPQG